MDIKELKKLHTFNGATGAKKSPVDIRDFKLASTTGTDTILPRIYEGTPPFKIKNQGQVGSCFPHAISETMEHLNVLDTGVYTEFSTGFIYGNKDDKTSEGVVIRDGLKFVNKTGDVLESDFPYNLEIPDIFTKLNEYDIDQLNTKANQHKIVSYFQLNSDEDIKRVILKYGYVVIGMEWKDDNSIDYVMIQDSNGNNIDYTATLIKGTDAPAYHCVILYGWNDDLEFWDLANSWSIDWGHNGCIRFPYTYGWDEAWGVEGNTLESVKVTPVDPVIIKPSDNPIYQLIAKIVNWILNLFKKK